MSARSAIEFTHDSDARRDVVRAVGAARRRLRTVSMVRLVAKAAPAGVMTGAVLALAGLAPAWSAALLGVLGSAAAIAWAVVRTPPVAAVARLLDARLGLRDRVAAAVQLRETEGPIAALVARDAAARLIPVRLTAVFPLALDRASVVSLALAGASLAWLVSSNAISERPPAARRTIAGEAASTEASARGRERAPESAGAGAAPAPPPTAGQAAAPRRAVPSAGDERASAREAFAPAATPPAPQSAEPAGTGARGPSANAAAMNRQSTPASSAANATGQTARGGAAAGMAANGGRAAGAGGAASGNAPAAAGGDAPAPPSTAASRTARAGAEAALARDVIPPDYRDHVRAYFRALSPPYTGAGEPR